MLMNNGGPGKGKRRITKVTKKLRKQKKEAGKKRGGRGGIQRREVKSKR